ncbi:hypothetical protein FQA39_LY01126 [Lamprigera yunnana]|nr:hypothetical protein FQA39_LY01126 [Lamprigera yunnana]
MQEKTDKKWEKKYVDLDCKMGGRKEQVENNSGHVDGNCKRLRDLIDVEAKINQDIEEKIQICKDLKEQQGHCYVVRLEIFRFKLCHDISKLNSRNVSGRRHRSNEDRDEVLGFIETVGGFAPSLVLCLAFAAASATYPYSYAHLYGQHIPVIDHNGVPVDTPEVQIAKAAHFTAHAAAHHGVHGIAHVAAPWAHHAGLHHYPLIDVEGRPLDTPEVEHAKAAHFHAYHEAAARNGHAYAAPYAVAAHVGIADTPEVQVAKAEHFAAHAKARAEHGHYRKRRGVVNFYPYGQHIPVIDHNGVPLDTPEVQAAKAEHFAAHAKIATSHPVVASAHLAHPVFPYAAPYHHYPIHIPVLTPQGVPVDTVEVQHEKAKHFAAHAEAHARDAHLAYHH